MYEYTINKEPDNQAFLLADKKIENAFPALQKLKLLIDVDGSLVQVYHVNGKKITLQNDFEIGAVYVESEIDLSGIFN